MDFGDERRKTHRMGLHRASGVGQRGLAGGLKVSFPVTGSVVMEAYTLFKLESGTGWMYERYFMGAEELLI